MQTSIPQNHSIAYAPSRKNGMISIAFFLCLLSFLLIMSFNAVTGYLTFPTVMTKLINTREVWNMLTLLPAVFGFVGTVGFVLCLIGTLSEIGKKTLTQHFTAFTGMGMGFFSFLIMMEYAIRVMQTLIR